MRLRYREHSMLYVLFIDKCPSQGSPMCLTHGESTLIYPGCMPIMCTWFGACDRLALVHPSRAVESRHSLHFHA